MEYTLPATGPAGTLPGFSAEPLPPSALPSPVGRPLVDFAVLRELEQQVDDTSIVAGFVDDFVGLWEARYLRLSQALDRLDGEAALDALTSIKTAAAMAGAMALSRDARDIAEALKASGEAAAKTLLPGLETCAQQSLLQLRDGYPGAREPA